MNTVERVDPEPVDPEPVDPEPVDPEPVDPELTAKWERQARHFESRVHFNRTCGVRVLEWTNRRVVMRLPHAEFLCNSSTGLHGGAIGMLADTCGTAAALAAIGGEGFIATVSMNISYLSAASSDVTATAVCMKPGKRLQVTEVRVHDAGAKLVAEAIVTTTLP